MKIAGVILAGGASQRMGEHKPLMPFRGGVLIDAVIARAHRQVEALAIDAPREGVDLYLARYQGQYAVIPDLFGDTLGPLCGIVTGLDWISQLGDFDWLASFPCDTPFLPEDLVAQLARAARDGRPVVAAHGGRVHSVCGLWPGSCLTKLKSGIESGDYKSVRGALEAFGGRECAIRANDNAFFNVNTREELQAAETIRPS